MKELWRSDNYVNVKIAIASEVDSINSQVSTEGGRAPYYLLFEDGKLVQSIKNPFRSGGGGAGPAMASMIADEGVKYVLSQHFGEKMIRALEEKNIQWKIVESITVEEALKDL